MMEQMKAQEQNACFFLSSLQHIWSVIKMTYGEGGFGSSSLGEVRKVSN
jgi:hypothetical protein